MSKAKKKVTPKGSSNGKKPDRWQRFRDGVGKMWEIVLYLLGGVALALLVWLAVRVIIWMSGG